MADHRYARLTDAAAAQLAPAGWRIADGKLVGRYRTGSMARGLGFVNRIVDAAEAADHHPDIDFRYGTVDLVLTTHAVGQLTDADTDLARAVAGIAAELKIEPA